MEVSDLWLPLVRTRPVLEGWILGEMAWMGVFWVVLGDGVFGFVNFCGFGGFWWELFGVGEWLRNGGGLVV